MTYIKKIYSSFFYYFFEIKWSIFFKMKYFLEKILQYFIAVLRWKYKIRIKTPYLFSEDYIIENNEWKFLVKHHTDFDYHIQPYYETNLLPYFNEIKEGIFFDIWWHFWRYTVKVWNNNKNNNIKIYAFEPNPVTYFYLEKNIILNNLSDKVKIFPFGLSSLAWKSDFVFFDENTGSSQIPSKNTEILAKGKWIFHNVIIELMTWDDFIRENNIDISEVKFLKIDVEWHELEVLKGFEKFFSLKNNECSIICEIFNKDEFNKINNFIIKFWFKYTKIDEYNYLFSKNR